MAKSGSRRSVYLLSPFSIMLLLIAALAFRVKALLVVIEVLVLLNYAYVYLPVLLYMMRRKAIRAKLEPLAVDNTICTNFIVLVPAHNEALALPALLTSACRQQYPADKYKVIVVADNCTDDTVQVVRSHGAHCIEKNITDKNPGKGACLAYACKQLAAQQLPTDTYVVVVDADCELDANYLAEVNKMLHRPGAPQVLQSYRYVKNVQASVVASLDAASETIRQLVVLGTRDMLRMNAFLHGSGTVFGLPLFLEMASREDESAAEDKEWNAWMLEHGIKIGWCPSAKLGYNVYERNDEFQKQRVRWVRGQFIAARKFAGQALLHGIARGSASQLDFSLMLYQFPRSVLIFMALACGVVNYVGFNAPTAGYLWLLMAASCLPYQVLALRMSRLKLSYSSLIKTGVAMAWGVARSSVSSTVAGRAAQWWSDRRGMYRQR